MYFSVCCIAEVLKMLRHVTVNCHGNRVLPYLSKDSAVANPYSTFMKILLLNFVLCCALSRNGLPGWSWRKGRPPWPSASHCSTVGSLNIQYYYHGIGIERMFAQKSGVFSRIFGQKSGIRPDIKFNIRLFPDIQPSTKVGYQANLISGNS